jgi:amino acid permease
MSDSRISNSSAVISTIVSTLGSGITFMPAIFNAFGIPKAILIMSFIGLITFISLYSIAYSADACKTNYTGNNSISYEGIAANFSKKLEICVAIALVLSSLSTAFSFVQIFLKLLFQSLRFSKNFEKFVDPADKTSSVETINFSLVKFGILAILSCSYYPIFKFDNLSSLSAFSKLSLFCCILFSFVTFGYGLFTPYDFSKITDAEAEIPKMDLGSAFGTVIFALHCQFSFPGILSSLKDQSLANSSKIILISSILATILYSCVGIFGYLGFGPSIGNATIIVSFGKKDSLLAQSLQSRFGDFLGLYLPRAIQTAYIPIFYSGIIFNVFSIIPILQSAVTLKGKPASRNVISIFLSLFIFASGVYFFDNLGLIFGFIGFLFVIPLSFLFPAIFVIYCTKKASLMKLTSYGMCLLSVVSMIVLFSDTVGLFKQ